MEHRSAGSAVATAACSIEVDAFGKPRLGVDTAGDEDLAMRLQAEELGEDTSQPAEHQGHWQQPAQSSSAVAPQRTQSHPREPADMSDAELAAMLQQEEEEGTAREVHPHPEEIVEHPEPPVTRPADSEAQCLSDAELARLLQEQEDQEEDDSAAAPDLIPRPGSRATEASNPLEGCMPFLSQICGGGMQGGAGAVIGCFTGLQLADCFGVSQAAALLCAIGGAILGAGSSSQHAPWQQPRRRRSGGDNNWYPESSDDDDSDDVPRGVDETTIANHSVGHVFDAANSGVGVDGTNSDGDQSKCMICMEQFESGDLLRTLPCLHRYHRPCADEWLRRSPECPICKRDITELSLPLSPPPAGRRASNRQPASGVMSAATRRLRGLLPSRGRTAPRRS